MRGRLFFLAGSLLVATHAARAETFTLAGYNVAQTGLIPEDLVLADLDQDGDLDCAVGDTNAGEQGTSDFVSVLLNAGGIFAPRVDHGVGDRPEGITVGRFNAGAALDLATANFNAGTVSVLLGNGTGGFAAAATYPVSGGPRGIANGDFDGDGDIDLATANYNGSSVSLLVGNGGGSFTIGATTVVGRAPEVIAAGRLNTDGFADAAVCNVLDDTVTLLTGRASGGFAVLATVPVGDRPRHVKLIDFNGDGLDDVLVANNGTSTVSVLRNSGGASFPLQATLSFPGTTNAVYINARDLNGDGRLDVLVSYAGSDELGVFPGAPAFTFGPGEVIPTGNEPLGIGAADLDADGRIDVVVANALDDNLHVFHGGATSGRIVLDNGAPGTSSTGTWSASSSPDPYGAGSLFAKATTGTVYTWSVPLPAAGAYSAFAWWTQSSSRVTAVPYSVVHSAGSTVVNCNQTKDGGQWNLLATRAFSTTATLRVSATSSTSSTCADAVSLLPLIPGNTPPTARIASILPNPAVRGQSVQLVAAGSDAESSVTRHRWRSSLDGFLSNAGSFTTSSLSLGAHVITLWSQDDGGLWSDPVEQTLEVVDGGTAQGLVLDNGEPGTSSTGSWSISGAPNPYGVSSLYAKNSGTYTYTFSSLAPGAYEVHAWWTQLATRPAAAPIDIVHASGTATVTVDQRTQGGQWNLLGTYSFGTTAAVRINVIGSTSTCADAVSLVPVGPPNTPPSAQIVSVTPNPAAVGQTVTCTGSGSDADGAVVAYNWRSSRDGQLSTQSSFATSGLTAGTHTLFFQVRDDGGAWSPEAEQTLVIEGVQEAAIIDNGEPGTSFTGSWSPSGATGAFGPDSLFAKNGATYTYTFSLATPGPHRVSAWWTQYSSRSTSVPIEITHGAGTSTVFVNQQANGGQWNELGTFSFGAQAVVKITAIGTASTCADAVSLTPVSATNEIVIDNGGSGTSFTGSWSTSGAPNPFGPTSLYAKNGPTYTFQAAASGEYRVHAWWTQLSTRPAAAPIAIQHAGGTTIVTVDQRTAGGQWNFLGTFTFDGQARITVTAEGTASTCADAVRLEPSP